MSIPQQLAEATGSWRGTSRLNLPFLPEGEQVSTCESTARVNVILSGTVVEIDMTWSHEGQPQEAKFWITWTETLNRVEMAWIDSWHMSRQILFSTGPAAGEGPVKATGSYQVPPYPEWFWRTEFACTGDELSMKMFNITPEGEEIWAVDATYSRSGS